ncbi:class III extradiol ring-cleavage dioxygenase [Streptomyces sp. NPDC050423]|uniref:DODA-type extradiol aromatic ring-opening family dioxygenase n=1 Tax=Streptomyces sp. NPDC050423 TaxID=3155402 RepID=UPI00343F3EDD
MSCSGVRYPAPGLPELVDEVSKAVKPTWVGADADSWGIDHGTWSVLRHAFPRADIPVVQLSINADKDLDYHFGLGTKLAALRAGGVLVLGSGNVVHNLGGVDPRRPDSGFDWAQRFDESAKDVMLHGPAAISRLQGHRDYRTAAPTPDHFIPLLYLAGLAAASGRGAEVLVDGYALRLAVDDRIHPGYQVPGADEGTGPAARLPDGVPADGTNT